MLRRGVLEHLFALCLVVLIAGAPAVGLARELPVVAVRLGPAPAALGTEGAAGDDQSSLVRRQGRCQRWLAIADSLGETFAGHVLRQKLRSRHCSLIEARTGPSHWEWPWNGLDRDGLAVPPRAHAAHGAWTIRCGGGLNARRCALAHEALPSGSGAEPGLRGITTHFVIDRVGGREVLLWRLFVPHASDLSAPAGAPPDVAGAPQGERSSRVGGGGGLVHYAIGRHRYSERFPVCAAAGCLMEVTAERAGAVATRLASDVEVAVEIVRDGNRPVTLALPSMSFAAGLVELIRLRRSELQAQR